MSLIIIIRFRVLCLVERSEQNDHESRDVFKGGSRSAACSVR